MVSFWYGRTFLPNFPSNFFNSVILVWFTFFSKVSCLVFKINTRMISKLMVSFCYYAKFRYRRDGIPKIRAKSYWVALKNINLNTLFYAECVIFCIYLDAKTGHFKNDLKITASAIVCNLEPIFQKLP